MACGGLISGNAPIKNAARMPSIKPKIILRAFGAHYRNQTAKHSGGGEGRLGATSGHFRHPAVRSNQQRKCSAVAAR